MKPALQGAKIELEFCLIPFQVCIMSQQTCQLPHYLYLGPGCEAHQRTAVYARVKSTCSCQRQLQVKVCYSMCVCACACVLATHNACVPKNVTCL